MGLLDSVLGTVMGGNATQGGGTTRGLDLGGIVGALTSNPQMLQAISAMLGHDGSQRGLGGLMARFQQAGLGDVIGSWVGTGANKSISGEQLQRAPGPDTISEMAARLGMNTRDTAGQWSDMLPGLIDRLTPNGQAPQGGLGNAGDLMGMLGGPLGKR